MSFVPAVQPWAPPSPRPLYFVCRSDGLLVRADAGAQAGATPSSLGPGPALLPSEADLRVLGLDPAAALYLGRLEGEDCFALPLEEAPPPRDGGPAATWPGGGAGGFRVEGLRRLWGAFDEELFFVAGRAAQVALWAQTHRFCGRCGAATERDSRERCARCPRCGLSSYPRISPAIIVLVRRGEQALLARSPRLPAGTYSTLAGFVEVGESLEETLVREVREEVGVEVCRPRYFGSQPWPFPHSLMVGFTAEYAGGEIRVDGEEILDARWFHPQDLPRIPPPLSIARRLIDGWLRDLGRLPPAG